LIVLADPVETRYFRMKIVFNRFGFPNCVSPALNHFGAAVGISILAQPVEFSDPNITLLNTMKYCVIGQVNTPITAQIGVGNGLKPKLK
jgi:hypothetical protein